MRISKQGLDLIKSFEGFRGTAYVCPAGVLTIGYGSTGRHVRPGMTISEPEAVAMLERDLDRFEGAVTQMAGNCTQGQFDALTSFAFNCGEKALKNSTLLRKHRAGDHAGASTEFGRWTKGGGKVLTGLVRRRAAEAELYRS